MRRINLLTGLACLLACGHLDAAEPAWWRSGVTQCMDTTPSTTENYQPVNQGQLKNVATKAALYLNATLASVGGAGTAVNNMVASFQHTSEDYAPINIGQLKAIAKPFYDRLMAVGYNTKLSLAYQGATEWSYDYPWNSATPASENYAIANIGQLKLVFSFDVTDSDADGLPDWWELQYGGSLTTLNGDGIHDTDGDGISDLAAYQLGLNPVSNHLNNATETENISYDAAHRITAVSGRSALGYTQDAGGNLVHSN